MPLSILKNDNNTAQIKKIDQTIAIAAGKGGVGKSTLTAQLAYTLAHKGLKVGIFDADLFGPSSVQLLQNASPPENHGSKIIPAKKGNISFFSLAFLKQEGKAAALRAPIANQLIQWIWNSVEWGELDFLLIDMPPGTADIQITIGQKVPLTGAVLITTPQELSLIDVRRAAHAFELQGIPLLGVIENMSYLKTKTGGEKLFPFGSGGGKKLSKELSIPLLAEFPLIPELGQLADLGLSPWEAKLSSDEIQAALHELAASFMLICKNEELPQEILVNCQVGPFQFIQNKTNVIKTTSNPEVINELKVLDSVTVGILWLDELSQTLSVEQIQESCPCAKCKQTERKVAQQQEKSLSVIKISSAGPKALHFQFSSGCSYGIYPYSLLRQIKSAPQLKK